MSAGLAAVSAPRSRTGGAHDDDGGPRSPSTLFNVEIRTQFQINSSAAARLPNAGVLFFFFRRWLLRRLPEMSGSSLCGPGNWGQVEPEWPGGAEGAASVM